MKHKISGFILVIFTVLCYNKNNIIKQNEISDI